MNDIHIVTGASSGVGRALCKHFATRGLSVLGVARRGPELEQLRDEHPNEIQILSADLGRAIAWQSIVDRVRGQHRVASLTHNAAISTKGYLKDISLEGYREMMAINVDAPFFLTQALLPHFSRGARVLHLSSGAAHHAHEYGGLYCITKAALLMIYRAWNADFPNREIVVGSASPGVVDTPMQERSRTGDHPGVERYRAYKEKGMLIQPSRVAEFLAWLLFATSDEDFVSKDWHINDESHHAHWLKGSLTG